MPERTVPGCTCCQPLTVTNESLISSDIPFTYTAIYVDYYGTPHWRDDADGHYEGSVGSGASVTFSISYSDGTSEEVVVPITDANVDDIGGNSLYLSVDFTDSKGFSHSRTFSRTAMTSFPISGTTYTVNFNQPGHD